MFPLTSVFSGLKKRFIKKAIVLMYHNVTKPDIDPWELAVSPSNFRQHMEVLKEYYTVSSIPDIIQSLYKGTLNNNCVAITFDDGYQDNFYNAKPLLEKYTLPATFFVTNRHFGEEAFLWWDKLASLFLRTPNLPSMFSMEMGGKRINFSLDGECILNYDLKQLHHQWSLPDNPPTKRSGLFYKLWQLMYPLPSNEIANMIRKIEQWSLSDGKHNECPLMTRKELETLASHPLFDLGLHTVNHVALSHNSAQSQEEEIIMNQNELETLTNAKITTLAYPYGDYNSTTMDVVKKLGLQAAFSVEPNPLMHGYQLLNAGRYQVKNWNAEQFEVKLRGWMKE